MLAAHRDQENLAHSQQALTKQQHKTPGARYPKTPSRYNQHDENAPTAFTGKPGLGGTKPFLGNEKVVNTSMRQALVTPMETKGRAPLGNKTTNAKAKNGQTVGGNDKTQLKATIQKPKLHPIDATPIGVDVETRTRSSEEEEPEYGPPKPKNLPYESDCFPKDVLTLQELKGRNLFKGYYQHFYNPIDGEGVSKQDREYEESMKKIMTKAEERNRQQTDSLAFNNDDLSDTEHQMKTAIAKPRCVSVQEMRGNMSKLKQPSTIASRRAASALSVHSDTSRFIGAPTNLQTTKTRKPLSTLIQGKKPVTRAKTSHAESAPGEAASRTTIGYNRGRSASSMMQKQIPAAQVPARATRPFNTADPLGLLEPDLTITPARLRQAVPKKQDIGTVPQFMSVFGADSEDDDPPQVNCPLPFSDDEDEFELRLNL